MSIYSDSPKLKLALVHPQYRPDGGAERAIVNTLRALENEVHVTVISRNAWQTETKGIDFIKCDPFYMGRLWRKWGFIRSSRKILKNLSFDLVQSQVRLPGCDIYRAGGGVHRQWLAQRLRISSLHRRIAIKLSPYHNYKLRMEDELYKRPDLKAVICNSEMVKQELLDTYDIAKDKIHVIYNAVDLDFFNPAVKQTLGGQTRQHLGLSEKEKIFLFVGSGFERKGLGQLIPAFAELPGDCHLVVVGKDNHASHYIRLAKSCGMRERIHFTGMQPDIRRFYAAADAFVLPTLYDAFANTVLEAMACGLPVLTGNKCGAVDIIENGKNGFVCDPVDKTALAECLKRLQSDELRLSMGTAGRKTVEKMKMDRMRENLLSLYRNVLESLERMHSPGMIHRDTKMVKFTDSSGQKRRLRICVPGNTDLHAWQDIAVKFWTGDLPGIETVPSSTKAKVFKGYIKNYENRLYFKQFYLRNKRDQLTQRFRKSRAYRDLKGIQLAAGKGLKVPAVRCVIEEPKKRDGALSAIITADVNGAIQLRQLLEALRGNLDFRDRRRLMRALGREMARWHLAGMRHGDARDTNILCRIEDPAHPLDETNISFWWIDNERSRPVLRKRELLRNLLQLNMTRSGVTLTDRMRFWRAYWADAGRIYSPRTEQTVLSKVAVKTRKLWQKRGWI